MLFFLYKLLITCRIFDSFWKSDSNDQIAFSEDHFEIYERCVTKYIECNAEMFNRLKSKSQRLKNRGLLHHFMAVLSICTRNIIKPSMKFTRSLILRSGKRTKRNFSSINASHFYYSHTHIIINHSNSLGFSRVAEFISIN